jgi:L-fuconolactonase
MAIIDAQVHVYERDHPARPWATPMVGLGEATGDSQIEQMDRLGIDGAIIVSTYLTYRFDASYAEEVKALHPGRFALVKPVNPADPAVEEIIAEWAQRPGAVGVRIMLTFTKNKDAVDQGLARVLTAAARHGLVVNLFASGCLDAALALAGRYPDTRIVIDHLGIHQTQRAEGPAAWNDLPQVLALAACDNVHVKLTGAPTLSNEPFPYPDVWDPLLRIIDAYGTDRCMWGTDWTRAAHVLSYQQGVNYFRLTPRLSESDRATLMGGAAEKIYGWVPIRK